MFIIQSLCLKPLKYLLFLGWCILGEEGALALEPNGDGVDTDGNLDELEIYYYVVEDPNLAHAIDLEVIKDRTHDPLETTETLKQFRQKLLQRDPCCVWTGVDRGCGSAMHIIPHGRGSKWLRSIVDNRPNYSENVETLRNINDIRNGVFAMDQIHKAFNSRRVAILKTPNHILDMTDVPERYNQAYMPTNVKYPSRNRYTLQWLTYPARHMLKVIPDNSDAAFMENTRKPQPSQLLLHYTYGAAAVKQWGHGVELLESLVNPRSSGSVLEAPITTRDRTVAIAKRDKSRCTGAGNTRAGASAREKVESEGKASWDEDDVMLFFWGNSSAAIERHREKVEESTRRMEGWREDGSV